MLHIITVLLLLGFVGTSTLASAQSNLPSPHLQQVQDKPRAASDKHNLSAPSDGRARRAAKRAEREYGGRAIAVKRIGNGYKVRLLLPDGRVRQVTIKD